MTAYIVTTILFIIQFLFSMFIGKRIKVLKETNEKIQEKLTDYIREKEKEYSLSNVGIFRLRVLTLFTKIEDEDKKEEIRNHMKSVVKENNGQPTKLLILYLTTLTFSVLCIYFLIWFFQTEPHYWLSIVVNILVIFFWISRKRWIFSILFGVFGYFVYPFMPAHLLLYVGLNMLKNFFFSPKKKSK